MAAIDPDLIVKVPLTELVTPRQGQEVVLDHWWVVDNDGAYFWQGWHQVPQCNLNREIVERLAAKAYPGARVEFIPQAFIDRGSSDG